MPLIAGGGSGAVAASSHAACERFRHTDPLMTGMTRRALARHVGKPDSAGKIPEARWVRAMAFEAAVNNVSFVSELLTRAVGLLELDRPSAVRVRSCSDSPDATAKELAQAHLAAEYAGEATMLHRLAVPFLSLEREDSATAIKPDFAIVAPRTTNGRAVGSWLIMGDAKDYERVRSRIDDQRILKGFLQVALGAESAATWSRLPSGMEVHQFGALAVPRNVYLRPEAIVEDLSDHRREVRGRAEERLELLRELEGETIAADQLESHLEHLVATYDPRSCASCSLFAYCRDELRSSSDPAALLLELGIAEPTRTSVLGLVDGTGEVGIAPTSVVANVTATLSGLPHWTGRRRVDMAGVLGSINVVLAKSDSAALGIHGIAVQRVDGTGDEEWTWRHFERTNATETRHEVMEMLGRSIRDVHAAGQHPVHLVVPDKPSADLLATMADSLAGVELSRIRWERDLAEGRPALTFDGEEATVPEPLSDDARLAVSFLLEEDRARAFTLRQPIVVLRDVLASHMVAGGPSVDSGRLDYLVEWGEASSPVDHRAVSDDIAGRRHTPGARLGNLSSDEIHRAGRPGKGNPKVYEDLVAAALDYRIDVLCRALRLLDEVPDSRLRDVHRVLEGDAQQVWGRRLSLEASDLVRFSRTYRYWRNALVDVLDADEKCREQLAVLADHEYATDRARDAGTRHLAVARVVAVAPVRLDVASRSIADGSLVAMLHRNASPYVEGSSTTLKVQAGSFKLGNASIGPLSTDDGDGLVWAPLVDPNLSVGDAVVLADMEWFGGGFRSGHELAVKRPSLDGLAAPKASCTPSSYAQDPETHKWCCRSHEDAEAEWSDELAARRERGELNPQVWPPVVDQERFDIPLDDDPLAGVEDVPIPDGLTTDDLGDA
ncbi:hypothetical protein KDN32_02340 [Nocardioides sp. J2M5]|uniref:hypothetical protein n=1 Tax=Nocardioides palaemonis TaxID=2829810 RepID=UPI001BAA45AF|nr:hypothetical protein [Nocardioides palaemonis]MBS2936578.1 hypothetical protein [Nocardioides palaemonis]